jgi:hypothetical protein
MFLVAHCHESLVRCGTEYISTSGIGVWVGRPETEPVMRCAVAHAAKRMKRMDMLNEAQRDINDRLKKKDVNEQDDAVKKLD